MDTTEIDNLKIVDDDDGSTFCERGAVHTNGDAAVIYDWDVNRGKYVQKDRLTEATIRQAHKGATMLSGVSQHLLRDILVPKDKAVLNLKLQHGQGKPLD